MSSAGCTALPEPASAYTGRQPYLCLVCGRRYADDYSVWRCDCGAPLWWDANVEPITNPDAGRLSLGEGHTPLFAGRWAGHEIWFKHEGLQPSGSFKDRGVALIVRHALANGVRTLSEDSSGNAGAAFAAYCAAAGIGCELYVPETTSPAKLAQAAAHGAQITRVAGPREAAAAAAQASRTARYAGHNWHPLFIEGVATLAAELYEQCGQQAPARVIVPVGNGSLALGLYRGFTTLLAAGAISQLPQLVGVRAGTPNTIAEGIAIKATTHDTELAAAIATTNGHLYEVTDDQIAAAWHQAAAQGLYIELTSAAALAGLDLLTAGRRQLPDSDEQAPTVVVLSGHGLKSQRR